MNWPDTTNWPGNPTMLTSLKMRGMGLIMRWFDADDSCGAVLMLGPFYNLSLPEERRIRSRGSFGTSTTSYGSSLPNYGTTHRANGDRGRQRRGKIRSSHRMRPPLAKPPRV